jgi:hypothetical protein
MRSVACVGIGALGGQWWRQAAYGGMPCVAVAPHQGDVRLLQPAQVPAAWPVPCFAAQGRSILLLVAARAARRKLDGPWQWSGMPLLLPLGCEGQTGLLAGKRDLDQAAVGS